MFPTIQLCLLFSLLVLMHEPTNYSMHTVRNFFIKPLGIHVYFINHGVVACYLELYEEGELEHINGVWPVFLIEQLFTLYAPSE